jgi:hypothetical protein
VVPARCRLDDQWRTHTVKGKALSNHGAGQFSYRHFLSISTNWKYRRYQETTIDPLIHRFDEGLDRALRRAGL